MWTRSRALVTTEVTKEQMWKLFSDVNNWHRWDPGIEFARMQGSFEKGNYFMLKPKGGPLVKVELLETVVNHSFLDATRLPLAKMYDHHVFEETADGLKITNTISVKGILAFLWIRLVAQNIVKTLPMEMERQVETARVLPIDKQP
jgi:Polyketide cyclase / dehydrase and lipid transport